MLAIDLFVVPLIVMAVFAIHAWQTGADVMIRRYLSKNRSTGPLHWFHALRLARRGFVPRYSWFTSVRCDPSGLYLAHPFLSMMGRRVHVPWDDIEVRDADPQDWRMEFHFSTVDLEMRLNKALAKRLLDEAGRTPP
ncbi:MAG TPA: hypothetical protein VHO25_14270 [Polyangiaceae bacterium]|nr:hypothetical protein [Polyangiaceae bacterium]